MKKLVTVLMAALLVVTFAFSLTAAPAEAQQQDETCKLDLMLVLDQSGSIGGLFGTVRTFAVNIVQGVGVAPDGAHAGVVFFNSAPTVDVSILDPAAQDETLLVAEINNFVYQGGGTNIQLGIEAASVELAASRADVPDVMIVLTDGFSSGNPTAAANDARAAGTEVFAVGIGNYDVNQLNGIGGDPSNVFEAGDEAELLALVDQIVEESCEVADPEPVEPVCNGMPATIWVDEEGIIRADRAFYGGEYGLPVPREGRPYDPEIGLVGTDRPDVIVGTDAGERIVGRAANDTICGYGGDDLIIGQEGQDDIWGGDGNDDIRAGNSGDDVWGEAGDDVIRLGEGTDYAWGGDGTDTIYGQTGNDHMWGEVGDDILRGGNGDDEMHGGDGNDDIRGQGNNDWMYGDAGDDFMLGGNGDDRMWGGEGTDDMRGQGNNDFMYGEAGDNDVLLGGGGDDRMDGGDGVDDRCIGQSGPHDYALGGCEITNASTEH